MERTKLKPVPDSVTIMLKGEMEDGSKIYFDARANAWVLYFAIRLNGDGTVCDSQLVSIDPCGCAENETEYVMYPTARCKSCGQIMTIDDMILDDPKGVTYRCNCGMAFRKGTGWKRPPRRPDADFE